MATVSKPTGYVIYRGPSLLNGEPIVVVALTGSSNRKTGNMLQTYILPDNGVPPTVNLKTGADAAVCGDCKHRPANGGACYVVVAQGPMVVWKTLQAGKYPSVLGVVARIEDLGRDRMVRLGTYGDPAAVPAEVWMALTKYASGRAGYTHQWGSIRPGSAHGLKGLVMASADTPEEAQRARNQGWRTFRIRLEAEALLDRESVCPASKEGGMKLQCAQCGLCNGAAGRKGSIAIVAHGYQVKRYVEMRTR